MEVSPYSLLKMLRNARSFSTLLNRFFRISDMNSTLSSSVKNKVSDPGVIFSVNYNGRPLLFCSLIGTSKPRVVPLFRQCAGTGTSVCISVGPVTAHFKSRRPTNR